MPTTSTTLSVEQRRDITSYDQRAGPYFGELTTTATQEFVPTRTGSPTLRSGWAWADTRTPR